MKHTLVIICTLLASAGCERSDPQAQQQEQASPSLQPTPRADQDTAHSEPSRGQPDITSPGSTGDERVNTSGRERDVEQTDTRGAGAGGGGSGAGASTGRSQPTGATTGSGTTGSGTAGPTGRDPSGSPRD